ncbi:hypothetical protein [Pedobacter ureilyticus]|uniref:Lipoprotein n=1 Tax=Pedobacter ureilyticus TaxID=1393051 RepID=A0ABW9JB06_9SPHI|nr:hypothetical protein [Pedobacter helvus]
MKQLTYILTFIISTTFLGCGQTKTTDNKVVYNPISEVQPNDSKETKDEDIFCDTAKIRDFKSNLTSSVQNLTDKEKEYQLNQAQGFIEKSCESDTLFCGEIKFKKSTTYKFDNEWKLLLTGYVLDTETGMEENSASFFVLTILRNNEFWFTDILEDVIGEIQVELNGFEDKHTQVTVWGHAYPYFQPDYGKFRLTVKNGVADYEFQCHAQNLQTKKNAL